MSKDQLSDLSESMSVNVITLLNNRPERVGFRGYLKSLLTWRAETVAPSLNSSRDCITQRDFTGYINNIASGIDKLKKELSSKGDRKMKKEPVPSVEDSVKYIPSCYFDEGMLPQIRVTSRAEARKEQEKLNEYLDAVEVCLFKHINVRFADFFKMLENIEYLEKAVAVNSLILAQARQSLKIVKRSCVDKVASIKLKSTQLQNKKNLQKLLLLLKQVKNAGSLLADNKQVSDSTLQILAHSKIAFQSLTSVNCVKRLGAQLEGLVGQASQKYSVGVIGKILQYISVPLQIDVGQRMREIPIDNAMDAQAFVNETILFDSKIDIIPVSKGIPLSDINTEKQLGKVLIQVYSTMCMKEIKALCKDLISSLEQLSNDFRQKLNAYLHQVLRKQKKDLKQQSNSILSELQSSQQTPTPTKQQQSDGDQQIGSIEQAADHVSMAFYTKTLQVHYQSLKICLIRFIGVLGAFMDEIYKMGIDEPQLFKQLIEYPYQIADFISNKIFAFMGIKKLSKSSTLLQFHGFLQQLMFWQDTIKLSLQQPLFKSDYIQASDSIESLRSRLSQFVQLLNSTKQHLQTNFISNIHTSVVNEELKQSLNDDTWVAVHNMPFNYMSIIYYILNGNQYAKGEAMNDSLWGERSRRDMSILVGSKKKDIATMMKGVDFKLLKNAIVVNKRHYRVTVCFLLFIEVLEEYLKIQELYPDIKEQVMAKINEVVQVFSNGSYELIVMGGALKLQKIKAKIITARHLCLSWSCIQLAQVLLSPITHQCINKSRQLLQQHSRELIKRLSGLMKGKAQQCITSLISLNLSEQHPCPNQNSVAIASSYRQMMDILQEHMPQEVCKQVMAETVELILGEYLEHLKTRGNRGHQEASFFIDDMKVLEVGFKTQLEQMKAMFNL